MAAEGGRKDSGRDGADDAVEIGHAGADRDQREHVEIARQQRLPAAHEERPAGPEHDGRGEGELDPVRPCRVDQAVTADEMAAHFQHDGGKREDEADPEPAGHVRQLGIGRRIEAGDLGLQRHAADRATSRADLADLRMHRAGVDRAFRHGGFRPAVFLEISDGIGGEFGPATGRAEMEGLAAVVEAVLAGRGIHGHAADGVAHGRCTVGVMIVLAMAGVVMASVVVTAAAGALGRFTFSGVVAGLVHDVSGA